MQPEDKKEKDTFSLRQNRDKPLSQTIENAHASGDGSIERDKDTILDPRQLEEAAKENKPSGSEAY